MPPHAQSGEPPGSCSWCCGDLGRDSEDPVCLYCGQANARPTPAVLSARIVAWTLDLSHHQSSAGGQGRGILATAHAGASAEEEREAGQELFHALRCAQCEADLQLGSDMWGPFYFCDDCGFSAETAFVDCRPQPSQVTGESTGSPAQEVEIMTEGPLPQPTRSIPAPRPRRRARPAVREAGFVVADDLPPALRRRVRSLLKNLSADDPSTAFLDFASLYRSVAETTVETPVAGATESAPRPPALIFGEDAQTVAEVCNGPDQFGMCPRAHSAGHAACAGRWLMASAWTFKVAPNAVLCPLVPLGLAPGPRLFTLGPGLEPDPKTHTGPIPRAS